HSRGHAGRLRTGPRWICDFQGRRGRSRPHLSIPARNRRARRRTTRAMKYVDEYRDPPIAQSIAERIARKVTRPWVLMEVCGGQTHTLMRYGIDELLPKEVELVHGPGCPVCVTPLEMVDRAIRIASIPDVIFTSYGDMLRVPGSQMDLFQARAG